MIMPNTKIQAGRTRNQEIITALVGDTSKRDGLLLSAWQRVVQGFSSRPFPRSAWDESFRAEVRYTAFANVVHPIRCAIIAAVRSGDKELIAKTIQGASDFCDELKADFLSYVPQESEVSIVAEALAETDSQSAAEPLEMALVANPSPSAAERAILPLQRHADRLNALVRKLRIYARTAGTPRVASHGGA